MSIAVRTITISSNAYSGAFAIAFSIYGGLSKIRVGTKLIRAQSNRVCLTNNLSKYFISLLLQVIAANTLECKQRPVLPSLHIHSNPLPMMKEMKILLLLIF